MPACSFAVPYLFRTPPGFNLLRSRPRQLAKDGVCALDGLVETDWAVDRALHDELELHASRHPISFAKASRSALVVPQRRGELARFDPSTAPFESDEETHRQHVAWARSRHEISVKKFLGEFSADFQEYLKAWETQYFKGIYPTGESAPEANKFGCAGSPSARASPRAPTSSAGLVPAAAATAAAWTAAR